jgi:hypothetical protein
MNDDKLEGDRGPISVDFKVKKNEGEGGQVNSQERWSVVVIALVLSRDVMLCGSA